MRLIIAGSRSIIDIAHIRNAIRESGWTPTEIISGDAEGADKLAIRYAKENHIDLAIFPANWRKYGRAAGYKRNQKMAWYANLFNRKEDATDNLKGGLVAIWNGKSAGTKHMIDIAETNGLPTHVYIVGSNGITSG